MTQDCPNCLGRGLVGGGDKPWTMQGRISTCSHCSGTGKLNADGSAAKVPETPPVDNSAPAPAKGSILNTILGKIGL